MKIAFISLMNGVPWGGSEELWCRTAKLAINKGHKVYTLTRKQDQTPEKINELNSLGAITKFFFKSDYSIQDRIAIKLKFKQYVPDVVPKIEADCYVISNGTTFDFLYNQHVLSMVLDSKKPYIMISQHNYENGSVVEPLQRPYGNYMIENAKRFFFVSERNLQCAERQVAYRIGNSEVISNPINIKDIGVKPFPESGTLLMACVARLDCNFKGQDILLQTLSSPKWKARNFSLKLYGTGPHKEYIRHLIHFYGLQEKVSMQGHANDIDEIWKTNQVLILPSLSEGTPLALVEAMLSGRAALATDVGDNFKYVLNGVTGFLAQTSSTNSLSVSLEELWNNRNQLKQMGEKAFKHSLKITELHPEEKLFRCIESLTL